MTISEAAIGKRVVIKEIKNSPDVKERLRAMGITVGKVVTVERVAPFGTPLEIKSGNFRLAIAEKEAKKVVVEYV